MIVYGDPQFTETPDALRARIARLLASSAASENPSLDTLRTLLIRAGQMEQAARDSPLALPRTRIEAITDHAATAFVAHLSDRPAGAGPSCANVRPAGDVRPADVSGALAAMGHVLDRLPGTPAPLVVKVPEGFAFYALFPEQYIAAARRWMNDHAAEIGERGVLVVGIRSIGTTLSAVVAATLAADGWSVRRRTVRPTGHPFAREVHVDPSGSADWALVVDEGPGLSGSSFAAVADALERAGWNPAHIAFLPGHGGEPGGAASESVRARWAATPRYVVSPDDLRWNGRSLREILVARTAALRGVPEDSVARIEDLGGGLWRHAVYSNPADWPAACAPFERPKYRCVLRDGTAILWKFAGLAEAETTRTRLVERAAQNWTPSPLDAAHGFVAMPWVEGVALSRAALVSDPELATYIGRYLAAVAGPPLSRPEGKTAQTRLREMLRWNVWEVLGEAASARAERWSERAAEHPWQDVLSYGDGRLAPWEWLRTPSGQLLKMDGVGHDADHTIVGRQALAWDIAGALVEWEMGEPAAERLLTAVQAAGGEVPSATRLTWYRLAYAAFRMGQCALCADMVSAHDPDEHARLRRAAARYGETLAGLLDD